MLISLGLCLGVCKILAGYGRGLDRVGDLNLGGALGERLNSTVNTERRIEMQRLDTRWPLCASATQ